MECNGMLSAKLFRGGCTSFISDGVLSSCSRRLWSAGCIQLPLSQKIRLNLRPRHGCPKSDALALICAAAPKTLRPRGIHVRALYEESKRALI